MAIAQIARMHSDPKAFQGHSLCNIISTTINPVSSVLPLARASLCPALIPVKTAFYDLAPIRLKSGI